jgi:hypothetical protein
MDITKSSKTTKGQNKKSDSESQLHATHENEEHASDTQQLQSNRDDANQPDLLKTNEAEVPLAGTGQSKSA